MNDVEYLSYLQQQYLKHCKDKLVLEIGPSFGHHNELIVRENPKQIDVIEGDHRQIPYLQKFSGVSTSPEYSDLIDNIIQDDAQLYLLENKKQYDVVICFGVLYHLHDPLSMLEVIINQCNPTHVILDCVVGPEDLEFIPEVNWHPGNRQPRSNWKSAGFNLVAPFDIVNESMHNMQYKLIKNDYIMVSDRISKSNTWIGLWEINQ